MLPKLNGLNGIKSVLLAAFDAENDTTIDIATASAPWRTPAICESGYFFYLTVLDAANPTRWVRVQLSGGEDITGGRRFTVNGFGESMSPPPANMVWAAGSPIQWVPGSEEFLYPTLPRPELESLVNLLAVDFSASYDGQTPFVSIYYPFAPAGDFDIAAKIAFEAIPDGQQVRLIVKNSVNETFELHASVALQADGQRIYALQTRDIEGIYSPDPPRKIGMLPWIYVRIKRVGLDIHFYYSLNGKMWLRLTGADASDMIPFALSEAGFDIDTQYSAMQVSVSWLATDWIA